MQTDTMLDCSPSADQNELDQLSQLISSRVPTGAHARLQQRRERPHQTQPANNIHRELDRWMVSQAKEASKATNSLQSAIMKRHMHSSNTTTSSSIESTTTTRASKISSQCDRRVRPGPAKMRLATSSAPAKSLLNYLIVTLTLSSCLFISHLSALESSPTETSSGQQQRQPIASERSDPAAAPSAAEPVPASSAASQPQQKSIVASLSSAVATAAAAAAVAAAQSGLSNSDARSLTSAGSRRHQSAAHRSPGLNLAIKLVDTIPEVPYNILHNMKKVDHAAPFYNVPNKFSSGSPKESSTQNFLANALTATGAGEQFGALFRSPLWKRIADGYGDFASEFRSLFRAPGASPMKGPSSSTSKILRDISVPAVLMLLASSMSGEWRPVRTRRKSFRPVDIPASGGSLYQKNTQLGTDLASIMNDQGVLPAAEIAEQPVAAQYFQRYEQQRPHQAREPQAPLAGGQLPTQNNEWLQQQQQQQQQTNFGAFNFGQQVSQVGQQARIRDDTGDLRPMDSQQTNWIAPDQQAGLVVGHHLQPFMQAGQNQNQRQTFDLQPVDAALGQQRANVARRSGEPPAAAAALHPDDHPDDIGAAARMPDSFKSFAGPAQSEHGSKLIAKLLDANAGGDDGVYRISSSLTDDAGRMSPMKRSDQLGDELRYSLVGADEISADPPTTGQQQPSLLSTMSGAVTSALRSRPAKSGSMLAGDKTIADERAPSRRQQPAEQRDLTKLLPESWREVVKRTMSTVQQQANSQWKSIEGQVANWVQEKLKTVAASASGGHQSQAGSSAGSSGSASQTAPASVVPAPIGNMLASVGSTALNILGLSRNNSSNSGAASASQSNAASSAQAASQAKSQPSGGDAQTGATNQRGKLEPNKDKQNEPASSSKKALAGVANLIASSISHRNSPSQPSSPKQSSSPDNNNKQQQPNAQTAHKSQPLGEIAASVASAAISSIASKYPTLTGTDASSHSSPLVPTTGQPAASPATAATPAVADQL
jgi:hypothetical protein